MANPVIKWVGGKRQLLPVIHDLMPKDFETYYEPFFGGGAVYFDIQPKFAVINDFNPQLIGMYEAIKLHPDQVERYLKKYQNEYNRLTTDLAKTNFYFELREAFNCKICKHQNDSHMAALLIFLNKAGFNGLYRISKAGKYNVPPAHKQAISAYTHENIQEVSKLLQGATVLCGDFEKAVSTSKGGDFVFFDSPYFDTFDSYQSGGFSEADHIRLFKVFEDLTHRNVKCMLTNSNTDFIKSLYRNYDIRVERVKRLVNSDASNRTGEEIIILNYKTGGDE